MPRLPLSPAEIAREAERCCAAGATVLHLHVRDARGPAIRSIRRSIGRAIAAVRQALGDRMVIQVTTEAVGRYSAARPDDGGPCSSTPRRSRWRSPS